MKNKIETINGMLIVSDDAWQVQSRYGCFPLSKQMQAKPVPESNGAWVKATVYHGQVISYHYAEESL